jgi:hypothetical protein
MPSTVYSLWSPEIKPIVQSPFMILQTQAEALTQITNGILQGDVTKTWNDDGSKAILSLDILVPSLGYYRHGVMTVIHHTEQIYPVEVSAACLGQTVVEAPTEEEFRKLVEKVLRSREVTSVAQSLIARVNELYPEKLASSQDHPTVGASEVNLPTRPTSDSSPS